MEFISIKVIRYSGNRGVNEHVNMNLNVSSISYVENEAEVTFRIMGDPNIYIVRDEISKNKILTATHE